MVNAVAQRARRSEGHLAVQFGDLSGGGRWERLSVFLNDRDVTNDCCEADAEEQSVILLDRRTGERRKSYGSVRVEGVLRAEDED